MPVVRRKKETSGRALMIFVLSKFRRPRPRQSEPSREVSPVRTLRNSMIQDATSCDNVPRPASCGFLRGSTSPNRDKSEGGSPRYPAISVAIRHSAATKASLVTCVGTYRPKAGSCVQ